MTDTVIKGSGNSRSLKTVPNALTLYPTHEALVAAMVDGTFPIDLGPLNDAGVQTRGMDLTKANLLSDATAALYGKGDNASPDDILAAIKPLIAEAKDAVKVVSGSYVGTNPHGAGNKVTLTLGFNPKLFACVGPLFDTGPNYKYSFAIGVGSIISGTYYRSSSYMTDSLGSINGTEIKLSSYFNELGQLYYYAAIG